MSVSLHIGARNESRSLQEQSVISNTEPSLQTTITASHRHSVSDQLENERGKIKFWRKRADSIGGGGDTGKKKKKSGKIIILFLYFLQISYHTLRTAS